MEYEFLKMLKRDDHFFNDGIQFNNGYAISIQCSRGHYCKPREDLADASLYDAFEVACFTPEGAWYVPKIFDDQFSSDIAAYISSDAVEEIYQHLKHL